jgi:hypothetical protein
MGLRRNLATEAPVSVVTYVWKLFSQSCLPQGKSRIDPLTFLAWKTTAIGWSSRKGAL